MNLRDTIAKQQEVWITKLDGMRHYELECHFCEMVGPRRGEREFHNCKSCPVTKVLLPDWSGIGDACCFLPSWDRWDTSWGQDMRARAARLVLADVNRIARHYHYKVRWE